MNRRAKFDAARFILRREIRNRTNKQTHTNSKRYISTPCLSAYVDKNRSNASDTVTKNSMASVYSSQAGVKKSVTLRQKTSYSRRRLCYISWT